jgi:hypothetical protein
VVSDTSSVPVEDRADFWATSSSTVFVPLECTLHEPASFRGLLHAGNVSVNMVNPLDAAPCGRGREMGWDALDLYTEVKFVWVSLS